MINKRKFFFIACAIIISLMVVGFFLNLMGEKNHMKDGMPEKTNETISDVEKSKHLAEENKKKEIDAVQEFTIEEKKEIPKVKKKKVDNRVDKKKNLPSQKNNKKSEEEKRKKNPVQLVSDLHNGLSRISSSNSQSFQNTMKLINQTYDIKKMLLMILGDNWKNANKNKKEEMVSVFREYIVRNYIKRFKKIQNPNFINIDEKLVGKNYMMVKTKLVINQNENININYLLTNNNDKWKIFDVLLAGSISEIATKKSEFNKFLSDGKIQPLITALKKKNLQLSK